MERVIVFCFIVVLCFATTSGKKACRSDANIRCKFMCSNRRAACACGLDGKTYKNYCEMRCNSFVLGGNRIVKSHNGPCSKECATNEFENFKFRFLEWFDLTERNMSPAEYNRVEDGIQAQEVLKIMFHTLDENVDVMLQWVEVQPIAEIPYEHCAVTFYRLCDTDNNLQLSLSEWGECFDQHIKMMPCDVLQSKAYAARIAGSGSYYPSCTLDGYCLPNQCDGDYCWCVSPSCTKDPSSFSANAVDFNCDGF